MFTRLSLAILIVSSVACSMTGPSGGSKAYMAPSMAMPAVRDDIYGTVVNFVREQKWTVIAANPQLGVMEVLTPSESSLGVPMRERWTFTVVDYEVKAARSLEVAFGGTDDWSRDDQVCAGYVYLRERQVLEHLGLRVAQLGSTKKYAQVTRGGRT
ncbi:MAG: hypothetical protein H7Z43_03340 [Clostridia bacterium]|nr:hypothetical protein [Deltaproteobacteria bacterium]